MDLDFNWAIGFIKCYQTKVDYAKAFKCSWDSIRPEVLLNVTRSKPIMPEDPYYMLYTIYFFNHGCLIKTPRLCKGK